MRSTTTRIKKHLEILGFRVWFGEKFNPHAGARIPDKSIICPDCEAEIPQWRNAGIRQDIYGFADLIAFHPDKPGVILVQSTSGGNHANRRKKILASELAKEFIQEPIRMILVASDSKVAAYKKDGTRSKIDKWKVRMDFLSETEFGKDPF